MNIYSTTFRRALPVLLIAGAAAAVTAQRSHDAAVARNLEIFNAIVQELELNYVDSIRTDDSFRAAIDAMLNEIDPYTEYFDEADTRNFSTVTTGEYGGIGALLLDRPGGAVVDMPYEGSPALRAGMKAGDRFLKIDSVDVSGKNYAEISKLLKGQPGTPVRITVARPYATDSIVNFEFLREKLSMPSVNYAGVINDSTGYIFLSSFMDKSGNEVNAALETFKADPKITGVILDLRNNGGGLLESAVDILGNFLPKGTEVLRTRSQERERIYKTTREPLMPDMPLAVIINGMSASASEITAGAIQDLDRGVLIGARSFGKGLVQSTRPLPYDGMLKVTISKYYIPSGRLIQAMDYAHRNSDGSPMHTPDSLAKVFYTAAGREVRDGGGLTPDIAISLTEPASSLVYTLVTDNHIFDYATKFASEHDSIPPVEDFVITDSIYADFKRFLDPSRLKKERMTDKMLDDLKEGAETEGFLTDSVARSIETLRAALNMDIYEELDSKRKRIEPYLVSEIASRYYYNAGEVRATVNTDKAVKEALGILRDPKKYRSILAAPKKAKKGKRK